MQNNTEYQIPTTQETHIPRVSIGMPVYNGEKYIREALDSVLAQTYTDFELVISDNASTDGTEAICREYVSKDIRIKYIRQPINLGLPKNFNYLLKHARGDYFTWLAHDDYLDVSFLDVIIKYLDENRDVVLCSGDFNFVQNGAILHTMTFDMVRDNKDWEKARRNFFMPSDVYMLTLGVYRLSIIHSYDVYAQPGIMGLSSGGEFSILSKLALQGRIVALPNVLRTYRMRDDSVAHMESRRRPFILPLNNTYIILNYQVRVVVFSKLTIRQKAYILSSAFFPSISSIIFSIIYLIWICLPGRWRRSLLHMKWLAALRGRIVR